MDEMNEENESNSELSETEDEQEENLNVEDLAEHADEKVDALIALLLKKGLFTEQEFQEEFDSLFENDERD